MYIDLKVEGFKRVAVVAGHILAAYSNNLDPSKMRMFVFVAGQKDPIEAFGDTTKLFSDLQYAYRACDREAPFVIMDTTRSKNTLINVQNTPVIALRDDGAVLVTTLAEGFVADSMSVDSPESFDLLLSKIQDAFFSYNTALRNARRAMSGHPF